MSIRAVVCPEYGAPEVLRIERRPAPRPGAGQARVRVPPPFVPGSEFSGGYAVGKVVIDLAA